MADIQPEAAARPKGATDQQRWRPVGQPWVGLGGLLLAAVVFFALAFGAGRPESSLLVLGPMSTFALLAVAMIAFWWNDWPGSVLAMPWTGVVDTSLVAGASVVLTIAAQAVVERSDLQGVFEANPGPGVPATFPATLALGGAAFTVMLQLSLVCERRPLSALGRIQSGIAALVLSWAVAVGLYFATVNLDFVPAAERAATGLRNPGGPVPAPDFGSALIVIGVWQTVIFIVLGGWPLTAIANRGRRLLTGNALVLGLGVLTFVALRDLAGWQTPAINAICGCIISGALIAAMLFEGWPGTRLRPGPGRALTLALTAVTAAALYGSLAAYADSVHWTNATPDEWITTASLGFIGAGVILHVAIGLRWPVVASTQESSQ